MTPFVLKITWLHAYQFIEIDPSNLFAVEEKVPTEEVWKEDGRTMPFVARCESRTTGTGSLDLLLKYAEKDNSSLKETDVRWGRSRITVDLVNRTAEARWIDDADKSFNLPGACELLADADAKYYADLPYESFLRIARPAQARVRQELLDRGEVCAISREACPVVLDLAHIIDVQHGGVTDQTNCILLRTDLHRLFDRRLLNISPDGVVTFGEGAPESYQEFKQTHLDARLFKRVARSLSTLAKSRSMGIGR